MSTSVDFGEDWRLVEPQGCHSSQPKQSGIDTHEFMGPPAEPSTVVALPMQIIVL